MDLKNPHNFLAFFLWLWIFVGFLLRQVSGWGRLSRSYRSNHPFEGQRWHLRRGRMPVMMGYHNGLTIGANSQGFFLAVLFLFRAGHPPLFIPWQDISRKTGKTLVWAWTEFYFRQALGVYLRIFGRLGLDIPSAAWQFWPKGNIPAQSQF